MTYVLGLLFLSACWLVRKRFLDAERRLEIQKYNSDWNCRDLSVLKGNLDVLRAHHLHRLESLESRVKNHDRASGGFHLCRDKSLVRLRDLTDAQLRHLLSEIQGLEAAAVQSGRVRDELERRKCADLYRQSEDALDRMRASAALAQVEGVSRTLGLRKRQILLQSLEVLRKWGEKK